MTHVVVVLEDAYDGHRRASGSGRDGLGAAPDEGIDVAGHQLFDAVAGIDALQLGIQAILGEQVGLLGHPDRGVAQHILARGQACGGGRRPRRGHRDAGCCRRGSAAGGKEGDGDADAKLPHPSPLPVLRGRRMAGEGT